MESERSSLKGRAVLVTGAAKRIGRSIALHLAREGARVLIHYRSSEAQARETAVQCGGAPIFRADLGKVSEIEDMFREIDRTVGPIYGLVNNAARFARVGPLEITEEDWDFIFDVNLKAVYFCAKEAGRRMRDAGEGRIVNISSIGGVMPWAEHAHYCASKAGVMMLTKTLAKGLGPGITVNSVAPGVIPFEDIDGEGTRLMQQAPAKRGGTPDEVANAVSFFLNASNFVTGQVLFVDGGLSLR